MDLESLRTTLIDAGRKAPANAEVPYAFETRVMANLPKAPVQDLFSLWGTALWKGAAACAAITALTVALSLWSFHHGADSDDDTLDMVVLAGADQLTETW